MKLTRHCFTHVRLAAPDLAVSDMPQISRPAQYGTLWALVLVAAERKPKHLTTSTWSQAESSEATKKAYQAIEINHMRPCRVEAGDATLLFCVAPKQATVRLLNLAGE